MTSKVEKEYRVSLGDTDVAGRVYFARVPDWCQVLWEEYLETKGLSLKTFISGDFVSPVVHIEFDYKVSLEVSDKVILILRKIESTEKSFSLFYEVVKKGQTEPSVVGKIIHVCVNKKTGKAIPIPEKLRSIFA